MGQRLGGFGGRVQEGEGKAGICGKYGEESGSTIILVKFFEY